MKYELIIYQCEKETNKIITQRSFVRDTTEEIIELINEFSKLCKYFMISFIRFEIKELK